MSTTSPSTAEDALDRAIWESTAVGLSLWQLMIGVLAHARAADHSDRLLAGHVALTAVAALLLTDLRHRQRTRTVADRSARWVAAGLFYAGFLVVVGAQLLVSSDELVVAVSAMSAVVASTPFLLMPWRWAALCGWTPLALVATLAAGSGDGRLALAVTVPPVVYSVGAIALTRSLRRFARAAQADADEALREHEHLVVEQQAARTRSNLSRTLHDTVVNTLEAIAAGGAAVQDLDRVRRRCAADVETVAAVRQDRRTAADLVGAGRGLAVDVAWHGDAVPRPDELLEELGDRAVVLRGLVKELLLNVEKHAGTGRARITLHRRPSHLEVTVSDEGRGFAATSAEGHDWSASVAARTRGSGIVVDLETAPGRGVRATILSPRSDPTPTRSTSAPPPGLDGLEQADALARRTAWWWCGALTVAGLLSTAIGAVGLAGVGSVVLVGLLCALAWLASRRRPALPLPVVWIVVAGVPTGYVLGFLGVSRPGADPVFWQAIGLTPLLVILLVVARSTTAFVTAAATLAVAAAVAATTATTAWPTSPLVGGVAAANGVMQLTQMIVWVIFLDAIRRISLAAAADRRRAVDDRAARAAVDAARSARQRWSTVQVDVAVDLLRSVALGRADPRDPAVRSRASREVEALRQLLLLDPDLVHLGPWLARSVSLGRRRGVRVAIRTGHEDVADPDTAARVGAVLDEVLTCAPSGSELVVGWFGSTRSPHLTVVGPAGFAERAGEIASARLTRLIEHDLLEIDPVPEGSEPPLRARDRLVG